MPPEKITPENNPLVNIPEEKIPLGKNPPGKKSSTLIFFCSVCVMFKLLSIFFYVIFKILLHSKLILSLIGFNLATLCNLVI